MIISDQQREENYQEYLRLLNNPDYKDVTFDEKSGGVSAVHKDHKFDKQIGVYGCPRGDYERTVIRILRTLGHRVVLESEKSQENTKNCDGFLNDSKMDIKAVESTGQWSISTKLREAEKQGAKVVVLFFPNATFYAKERVIDGIEKYETNPRVSGQGIIDACVVIVSDQIVDYYQKTTTPSAGWF